MISSRILVLGEQGLQSATSFLANIAVARHYANDDYAAFSLAVASSIFIGGIQRALIVIPFVVSAHGERLQSASTAFCHANLLLTAICAALGIGAGLIVSALGHPWLASVMLGAGVLCAGSLPYELCRRWLLQHKRYAALLAMSSVYSLCLLSVVFIVSWHGMSLWILFLGMTLSTAGAAIFLPAMRAHPAVPLATLVPGGFRFWNVLSHLSFSGYNYAIQAIQGATIGKAELGAFYATRNLYQPVQVLVMAVDSTDKPRAAAAYSADGRRGLFRSLLKTGLTLLALGVPYLALVYLFNEPALHLLYKGKFDQQSAGGLAWIGFFLAMMLTQPIETGIYAVKKTKILFLTRLIAAAVGIACCLFLSQSSGYSGAIVAMTIAWSVALIGAFAGLAKAAT